MDRHTIILTTDERQAALGKLLPGRRVLTTWAEYERKDICEKVFCLPTPVRKLDNDPELKEKLKQELISCKGPVMVFAGALDREWKDFLETNAIAYWDFMQLPEVVEANAHITAEATVAEVLIHGKYSIQGQRILVTGFGCCGEKIAKLLHAMGAKVTVAARRPQVRKQIGEFGMKAISFEDVPEEVEWMKTVINTVPACVITEEVISNMQKDALIVDIASAPGGTDFEAAREYGIKSRLAPGLPGIYTTTSSARVLKEAMHIYAPLQDDVREDGQWIFQIIM